MKLLLKEIAEIKREVKTDVLTKLKNEDFTIKLDFISSGDTSKLSKQEIEKKIIELLSTINF